MLIAIDPELGAERHGEVHHFLGLRDNDGLPFEASEPVALPTVIPFDVMRQRFALYQLILRDHRGIGRSFVRAIELHIEPGQAINHLLQRHLVTASTFPVEQLSTLQIERLPDPELLPLCLHIVVLRNYSVPPLHPPAQKPVVKDSRHLTARPACRFELHHVMVE